MRRVTIWAAIVIGTVSLRFALDLDYWHAVALQFGTGMTAYGVDLMREEGP